jgi:hypothetical protein
MTIDWSNPRNALRLGELIWNADKIVELANGYPDGLEPTPAQLAILDQVLAEVAEEEMYAGLHPDDAAALREIQSQQSGVNGYGLSSGPDLATSAFMTELADYAAAQGDYDVAAETAAAAGMGGVELANGSYAGVIELANAAVDIDARRAREDAAPLARRSEDRVQHALSRAARGTLTPRQPSLADFASPSQSARTRAEQRWQQSHVSWDGQVGRGSPCGVIDATGRCGEPYHSPSCGSLASTDIAEGLQASGAYARIAGQAMLDADGRSWGVTMGGWLESATGQRQAQSGWQGGSRELTSIRRHPAFGNPDDPDAVPQGFPASTRATAAALAAQAGLTVRTADEIRASASVEQASRITGMLMSGRARPGPDDGESTRERRERMHRPAVPVPVDQPDDGLRGALPQYMAGQL